MLKSIVVLMGLSMAGVMSLWAAKQESSSPSLSSAIQIRRIRNARYYREIA